jgi:hypothetical protein
MKVWNKLRLYYVLFRLDGNSIVKSLLRSLATSKNKGASLQELSEIIQKQPEGWVWK